MADPTQLPYLIQLIDDDSPVVQDAVIRELDSFGPSLQKELDCMSEPPTVPIRKYVTEILDDHRRDYLKECWTDWMLYEDDADKLEIAFSLISEFQNGMSYPVKLSILLDKLADEYSARFGYKDVLEVAHFLFTVKKLTGSEEDYYNPRNSNLIHVIQSGKGIPISLVCVYILVAYRLGMNVEGCNLPGHFLARVQYYNMTCFLDCFNGGHIFEEKDLKPTALLSAKDLQNILHSQTDAVAIIRRVLINLVNAYEHNNDKKNSEFIKELLNETIPGDVDYE